VLRRIALCLLYALSAKAQKFYTYVTDLGPTSVELSWGTTAGVNTIGRSSPSHGPATVKVGDRTALSRGNSITFGDLQPDREYTYDVTIGPTHVGSGHFRTWADHADKLAFFVIGDYGTGQAPQQRIAQAMWDEFKRREATGNPIRFMLSTGDNIYGNLASFVLGVSGTGASDRDWTSKFFEPYQPLIARVPFFGTLGNHDGNETESRRDLPAFLDNFPFPGGKPARYYTFTYGGFAEFLALDSTKNTESGHPRPNYLPDGEQSRWLQAELNKPKPAWVIPFYHHPVFSGGPLHAPALHDLQHWVDLFGASGVKVVFNGHEHNFQMSEVDEASRGIRFITSGAGGELRAGDIQPNMKRANIAAWAPQNHFLVVEIEGKTMKVTPLGYEPVAVKDASGHVMQPPFVITLP
jgi:hypothetical protein